jgi:uncharacterized protein (UPF0335 family)
MSNYSKDMFKQLTEIMERCDKLDNKIADIREEHKKEITKIKEEHKKEVKVLNERINILTKENKELREENKILKADNTRMKSILSNNSSNTSLPPSKDQKGKKKSANEYNGRKKSTRKKGGQPGHKGNTLTKEEVKSKIETGEFEHEIIHEGTPSEKYISKYVVDIKVTVIAKEHRFYPNKNGKIHIPSEYGSNVIYGPNLKAIAIDLNGEGIVSNERIKEFINTLTDGKLNVSSGSIYEFGKSFQKKISVLKEQIANEILNQNTIYTDATVVTVNGEQKHIRNHSVKNAVYYSYTGSKTIKNIKEKSLLDKYFGTLVHDHETALYHFGVQHGECNAHVQRYLRKTTENTKHKWSEKLSKLLSKLNDTRNKLMSEGSFFTTRAQKKSEAEYDLILSEGRKEYEKDKENPLLLNSDENALLKRMVKYKRNHLLFIYDKEVDFTNNRSERDLRKLKNKQKMSGGFRNEKGCELFCDILTVIETCKCNNKKILSTLISIFENKTPTLI